MALKKIQKVEKALIDAGIEYDYSFEFASDLGMEVQKIRFAISGQRFYFSECEDGSSTFIFQGFVVLNPYLSEVIEVIENAVIERKDL